MKNNDKRIHPPLWQHDYHVLTKLYQAIKKSIKLIKLRGLLVDYGCGDLPYKHLFKGIFKEYAAVDIGHNPQADILVKEDQKLPFKDKTVDLILSTQVLEHVREANFYMEECQRIVRSGGYILVSTHGVWPYHEFPHDYNRWTRTGLEGLLTSYGFKIINTTPILTGFAMTLQFEMLLFAEIFAKWGVLGKIPYLLISLTGNFLIWLLNIFSYDKNAFDASVFVILAQRQ